MTSVLAAVVGLLLALPMHWMDLIGYDWITHLGPIYIATIVFLTGAVWAWGGVREPNSSDVATTERV